MCPFLRSTLVGTFAASSLALTLLAPFALAAWNPAGESVPADGSLYQEAICDDGSRGLDIFWHGYTTQQVVYAQRRLADGTLPPGWLAGGNLIAHTSSVGKLSAAPDGAGGAWLIGQPYFLSSPDARVRVWRVTSAGGLSPGWPDAGVLLGDSLSPKDAFLADDGAGGVLVGWVELMKYQFDERYGLHSLNSVRLVRLGGDGAIAAGWSARGNVVFEPDSTGLLSIRRVATRLVADGTGGGWICHADSSDGLLDSRLFRMTPGGALAAGFGPNGVLVGTPGDEQVVSAMDGDGAGGVFALGFELGATHEARLGRFQSSGLPASGWTSAGIELFSGVPGDRVDGTLAADGLGGAVVSVALGDSTDLTTHFHLQRHRSDGAIPPGWPASGVVIDEAVRLAWSGRLVSDAAGGAFFVGLKEESTYQPPYTFFATRVAADGSFPAGWSAQPLVVDTGLAEPPLSTGDHRGALFVLRGRHYAPDPGTAVALRFGPDGSSTAGIGDEPGRAAALRAFPNPMHAVGSVQMTLPGAGLMTVEVIDAAGRHVRTLARSVMAAGPRRLEWDGRDERGQVAPPGVYLLRVHGPGVNLSQRVVRLL